MTCSMTSESGRRGPIFVTVYTGYRRTSRNIISSVAVQWARWTSGATAVNSQSDEVLRLTRRQRLVLTEESGRRMTGNVSGVDKSTAYSGTGAWRRAVDSGVEHHHDNHRHPERATRRVDDVARFWRQSTNSRCFSRTCCHKNSQNTENYTRNTMKVITVK